MVSAAGRFGTAAVITRSSISKCVALLNISFFSCTCCLPSREHICLIFAHYNAAQPHNCLLACLLAWEPSSLIARPFRKALQWQLLPAIAMRCNNCLRFTSLQQCKKISAFVCQFSLSSYHSMYVWLVMHHDRMTWRMHEQMLRPARCYRMHVALHYQQSACLCVLPQHAIIAASHTTYSDWDHGSCDGWVGMVLLVLPGDHS